MDKLKYKFLYRLLCSFHCLYENMSIKTASDLGTLLYTESYEYVYKFKKEFPKVDITCLEQIFEKYILNSFSLLANSPDENFKVIRDILKNSTLKDFKVYYFFQLFLQHKMIDYFADKVDGEDTKVPSKNHLYLLQSTFILFLILAGGILYLPLNLRNSYIKIGVELDKIFNSDYDGKLFSIEGLSKELIKTGFLRAFTSNLLKPAYTPVLSTTLLNYYYSILSIILCCTLDNSSSLREILSLGDFKFSISRVLDFSTDNCLADETLHMYHSSSIVCNYFYDRKVLLPTDGVIINCLDDPYSSFVFEFSDSSFGHVIVNLTRYNDIGVSNCCALFLSHNLSTITRPPFGFEYMLDLFNIYDEMKSNPILSFPTRIEFKGKNLSLGVMSTKLNTIGKYEVLKPSYWKYKWTQKKVSISKSITSESFLLEKRLISPFKRKLPNGYTRSAEASQLAKQLCIKLNDDETVVSEFERFQKSTHFNK